ncbi:MAG TPA: sodium/glutamate symporter, partial [Spirochaetota bacterium]|nr:sodium/glutamate symporter [Spirochaetota bacterium]
SFGQVWETQYGFTNASTIGLTFAAIGFLVAFFVGIPLIRWGVKKGLPVEKHQALPQDLLCGIISDGEKKESAGELTTHSGNVETLAVHMALVGLVYILAYFFTMGLVKITSPNISKSLFGFFFFFGLFIAVLVRIIMTKLGIRRIIDPGIQRRITGWSVDFLLVGTIMAIQLVVVWEYIVPIALMSVAAAVVTTWSILYLGRRIDTLNFERTMTIFGTCTGTVSTGLLLLRVIDPEFRTPVAFEIGIMNMVAMPIIVASMLLVNAPVWWGWNLWLVIGANVLLLLISIILILVIKMWGKPKF